MSEGGGVDVSLKLRDWICLAGVGLLMLAVFLPVLERLKESAGRAKCASYLRSIGQAMMLYANENKGKYPRTIYAADNDSATPVWGTGVTATDPFSHGGPGPNDVSAALFLLLTTQQISSEVFLCPSAAGQEKDMYGGSNNTAQNRSNFTDLKANLSYSYQNPYPTADIDKDPAWLSQHMNPEFAIMADKNPGTAGPRDNVFRPGLNPSSPQSEQAYANSNNHGKRGQNVLFAEGHVEFVTTPWVGIRKDNIYTSQGSGTTYAAPSKDVGDSILLPTDD